MKILSADYVLPISSEPIKNGAVVLDKNKIVAVGARSEIKKEYPQSDEENFGEAAILPGFVNAHAHLELTVMRGFLDHLEGNFSDWLLTLSKTRAEKLTESDIEVSALWGALEMARGGVTCVADIGRHGRAGFEALKKTCLRGVVYQETEFSPKPENAQADFEKLKEKLLALREDETALVKAGISPHSPFTVNRKLFEIIGEYAQSADVKLSIHAAESKEEVEFVQHGTGYFADVYQKFGLEWNAPGVSPLEYLAQTGILNARPLLAHCVKTSENDFALIAESESGVAHCPKSNAKFGHGVAPFEGFLRHEVRVGFGSDSVASNNTCDILEEARFAALFARSLDTKTSLLTASEIIETATLGGARSLGMDGEIGSLEAGKEADLTVISLGNAAQQPIHDVYAALLFASSARDVVLTVVAGEEIYRDSIVRNIDETKLRAEINLMAQKMI